MRARRAALYYAWSRPAELAAPLEIIENRFPALFESRRMLYPRYEALADPVRFDQGVGGFLDHIMKRNFAAFLEQTRSQLGSPVVEIERIAEDGHQTGLDALLLDSINTVIIISFDSLRTAQQVSSAEIQAIQQFLTNPDNLLFVCPHHDIGGAPESSHDVRLALQIVDFLHHGDKTIPPQQRFGGFSRSLLRGLGVPVENRFGLRPAAEVDGSPALLEIERTLDRLGIMSGVSTFNLHPHLPHFERLGDSVNKLDVLARQEVDPTAPPHPFTQGGRATFDALLQSRPDVFAGTILVGDATLFSSNAGGVDSLRRLWTNVMKRSERL